MSSSATLTDRDLLALHAAIVEIPSISKGEDPLATWIGDWLAGQGHASMRYDDNVVAIAGPAGAPIVCLNSHLDTVPPVPGWTHPPHEVVREGGRVHGLGSNDAKASVAAMLAAFVRRAPTLDALGVRLMVALSSEEETGSRGTEVLVPRLEADGIAPSFVVVGEPTALDVAVAQKGLLVLELRAKGTPCHAAHGRALSAPNAIRRLAADLVALERVDLGPDHPLLGPVTLEPTMITGGTARNVVPGVASCVCDVRVNPGEEPRALAARIGADLEGEVVVLSDRLRPYAIDVDHPLALAARRANPHATLFGSRGLSDLVFFRCPGIKVGPGKTERSHTADEFVLEEELIEGARFYERLVREAAVALAVEESRP